MLGQHEVVFFFFSFQFLTRNRNGVGIQWENNADHPNEWAESSKETGATLSVIQSGPVEFPSLHTEI